jgi:hypothetical protein
VIIYDKNDPAWGNELRNSIAGALEETLKDTASAVPSMFRRPVKSQAPTETKTDMRLDLLEREVASLAIARRTPPERIRSVGELYERLRRVTSRTEAIEVARSALSAGMPAKIVSKALRGAVPPAEAKAIFAELRLRP